MPNNDDQDDQEIQQAKARYAANAQYALPGPYQTKLNDQDEAAFQQWVKKTTSLSTLPALLTTTCVDFGKHTLSETPGRQPL